MRTRAAVAFEAGKPLEITEVDLDGPRAGEVLVEIKATGICHTDEFTLSGADPEGIFPAILGHEGAGVVVDVGPGVTIAEEGRSRHPALHAGMPRVRILPQSARPICARRSAATQGQGLMPDGTSRFRSMASRSSTTWAPRRSANYTVVPEIALAKIREDAPFDKVCYIGCGVTTGIGAVINTAKVEPGCRGDRLRSGRHRPQRDPGLRLVGRRPDRRRRPQSAQGRVAKQFGMTDFVNPKEVEGDLVPYLVDLTKGGADYTFECIGNVERHAPGARSVPQGLGRVHHHRRSAGAGEEISTRPFQLVTGRSWRGTAFGGARGRTDVPQDRRLVHGRQDRDRR